jgi:hypothetical protein
MKGNCLSHISALGLIWTKVSELLTNTTKVPHGDLVCLQRVIALLSHDLHPKDFYPERDKSG